jgi:hypothetical protein
MSDQFLCDACQQPVSGTFASVGGNWVPFTPAKCYHMSCIPPVRSEGEVFLFDDSGIKRPPSQAFAQPKPAPLWTATPGGHLMYRGRPVADLRYANARGRITFIVDALNAAEENHIAEWGETI